MPPRMKVETENTGSNVTRVDASSKSEAPKAPKLRVDASKSSAPASVAEPGLSSKQNAAAASPKPSVAASAPKPLVATSESVKAPTAHTASTVPSAPASKVIKATIEVSQPSSAQPTSASTAKSATAAPKTTAPRAASSAQATKPKIGVQSVAPEYDDDPVWESADNISASATDSEQEPQAAPKKAGFKLSMRAFSSWVHTTFPGHEHAFMGGVVALLLAILILVVGPLHVILLSLAIVVGVAVGQYFDGDPKIIRMITGLFNNDREQ